MPFGAISSSTTVASRASANDRGRMSTAISSVAMESARVKPVVQMTMPATTASTDPNRSATTSLIAPRMLSEPRSARASTAIEMPLATSPTAANATIGPASTCSGDESRLMPAYSR